MEKAVFERVPLCSLQALGDTASQGEQEEHRLRGGAAGHAGVGSQAFRY